MEIVPRLRCSLETQSQENNVEVLLTRSRGSVEEKHYPRYLISVAEGVEQTWLKMRSIRSTECWNCSSACKCEVAKLRAGRGSIDEAVLKKNRQGNSLQVCEILRAKAIKSVIYWFSSIPKVAPSLAMLENGGVRSKEGRCWGESTEESWRCKISRFDFAILQVNATEDKIKWSFLIPKARSASLKCGGVSWRAGSGNVVE